MTELLVIRAFGNVPPPDVASLKFTTKARKTCRVCMFDGYGLGKTFQGASL